MMLLYTVHCILYSTLCGLLFLDSIDREIDAHMYVTYMYTYHIVLFLSLVHPGGHLPRSLLDR